MKEKNKKVHDTNIEAKKKYWPKFAKFMENQFNHGGDKYSMPDDSSKEITDWVCELSPGETGADWILQTMCKYIGRYRNFQREKDLFKKATYTFILWLKMGYHLQDEHDEDVKKEG